MQNLSDNELDELFKKAATRAESDAALPDWPDMARRLDKEKPVAFLPIRTIGISILIVAGIAALVWVGIEASGTREKIAGTESTTLAKSRKNPETKNESPEVESADTNNAVSNAETIDNPAALSTPGNQNNKTLRLKNNLSGTAPVATSGDAESQSLTSTERSVAPLIPDKKSILSEAVISLPEKENNKKIVQPRLSPVPPESDQTIRGLSETEKPDLSLQESKNSSGHDQPVAALSEIRPSDLSPVTGFTGLSTETETGTGNTAQNNPAPAAKDTIIKDTIITEKTELVKITQPANKASDSVSVEQEKKPANKRFFSVKLAVSPDYSTVESVKPNHMGINYGMLLEYTLTKNISVAAGGIRAKKIYSAVDVEYGNGKIWNRVDGDCRMWDIPLNVYYHFRPEHAWSFYAGIGASSYLMSRENYVYCIERPSGTITYDQSFRGKNNEWFRTLNILVGFSMKLNNRFVIQLEPFYKAPLAGVGEGDVSLTSFGAFLNLKYNFVKPDNVNDL